MYWKSKQMLQKYLFRYCLKGFSLKNYEKQRGGPKRGNPTIPASTITARGKGDPQHIMREK